MKDFIVHSDVGEFQSEKIKQLVRCFGGEIQKGSAYTPEQQCFMERGWRTIKAMTSTMTVATGLGMCAGLLEAHEHLDGAFGS